MDTDGCKSQEVLTPAMLLQNILLVNCAENAFAARAEAEQQCLEFSTRFGLQAAPSTGIEIVSSLATACCTTADKLIVPILLS